MMKVSDIPDAKCSFCGQGRIVATLQNKLPSYRCKQCNVRIEVTNPSSMSTSLRFSWKRLLQLKGLVEHDD